MKPLSQTYEWECKTCGYIGDKKTLQEHLISSHMEHEMQPRETSKCKVCNHPLEYHYNGKGCDYKVEGQQADSCRQCEEEATWMTK